MVVSEPAIVVMIVFGARVEINSDVMVSGASRV